MEAFDFDNEDLKINRSGNLTHDQSAVLAAHILEHESSQSRKRRLMVILASFLGVGAFYLLVTTGLLLLPNVDADSLRQLRTLFGFIFPILVVMTLGLSAVSDRRRALGLQDLLERGDVERETGSIRLLPTRSRSSQEKKFLLRFDNRAKSSLVAVGVRPLLVTQKQADVLVPGNTYTAYVTGPVIHSIEPEPVMAESSAR